MEKKKCYSYMGTKLTLTIPDQRVTSLAAHGPTVDLRYSCTVAPSAGRVLQLFSAKLILHYDLESCLGSSVDSHCGVGGG
jgi:hypothetical protein